MNLLWFIAICAMWFAVGMFVAIVTRDEIVCLLRRVACRIDGHVPPIELGPITGARWHSWTCLRCGARVTCDPVDTVWWLP